MLVWTQSIPGIKEQPVLDWWNHLVESDRRVKLVLGLAPLAFLLCVLLFNTAFSRHVPTGAVLLFLGITLSSKFCNIVVKDFTFDLEPAAFVASLLVVGPMWATLYSLTGILVYEWLITRTLWDPEKTWMNLFNIETSLIAAGSAASVYGMFSSITNPFFHGFLFSFLFLCISGFVLISLNEILVSLYFAVLDKVPFVEVLRRNGIFFGDVMFSTLASLMFVTLIPIGFLFGALFLYFPPSIGLFLPVLTAIYYLPKLIFQIKSDTVNVLESITDILGRREGDGERIRRVSRFTQIIAHEMGLSPEEIDACAQSSRLCHIGNIAVPDVVLNKPSRLSKEEYRHVQEHVEIIPELFPHIEQFSRIVRAAMLHHEWFDGTGYPFGLKGPEIPLEARVVGVADAWDAMTCHRCYRDPVPEGEALQTLLDGAGIQWDPRVVQALMKAYEEGKIGAKSERAA